VAQPVQPHLDRTVGKTEAARDRLLGEVLGVAQLDQLALTVVKAADRGVQVGALDRGDDLLVLRPLDALKRRDRIGTNSGVEAEGLVADDRRQPLLAPACFAQRRAAAPGPQ